MNTITINSLEGAGKVTVLKPDEDTTKYDPAALHSRVFTVRDRQPADEFKAVDTAYEILAAVGIESGVTGYKVGEYNYAESLAVPFLRCVSITDGEMVNDKPTIAELVDLPPDVYRAYASQVRGGGRMTTEEIKAAKKPLTPAPVEDTPLITGS